MYLIISIISLVLALILIIGGIKNKKNRLGLVIAGLVLLLVGLYLLNLVRSGQLTLPLG